MTFADLMIDDFFYQSPTGLAMRKVSLTHAKVFSLTHPFVIDRPGGPGDVLPVSPDKEVQRMTGEQAKRYLSPEVVRPMTREE